MSRRERIILVGAGGFGREVASALRHFGPHYEIVGHIDDEKIGPGILGTIESHKPYDDVGYVTCFGQGDSRQKIRISLSARGAYFESIISPTVQTTSRLDNLVNCVIVGACSISNDVSIGSDVLIQTLAVIGHDVTIGDAVTISSHAFIGGGAILDDQCTIHPHAVVLPGVKVGKGAVVGAGTVAIRNVPAGATIFGVPAKIIVLGPN